MTPRKSSANGEGSNEQIVKDVLLAKVRDRAAFDRLVLQFQEPVLSFLCRMNYRGQDPEDVLQEGLLWAWQKIGELEKPGSFRYWLITICKRCASRNHASGSKRKTFALERLKEQGNELPDLRSTGADRVADEEVVERFREIGRRIAVMSTSKAGTAGYVAYFLRLRGRKLKAIAKRLGRSEFTVRSDFRRFRNRLFAEVFALHQDLVGGSEEVEAAFRRASNRGKSVLTVNEREAFSFYALGGPGPPRPWKYFLSACLKVLPWIYAPRVEAPKPRGRGDKP